MLSELLLCLEAGPSAGTESKGWTLSWYSTWRLILGSSNLWLILSCYCTCKLIPWADTLPEGWPWVNSVTGGWSLSWTCTLRLTMRLICTWRLISQLVMYQKAELELFLYLEADPWASDAEWHEEAAVSVEGQPIPGLWLADLVIRISDIHSFIKGLMIKVFRALEPTWPNKICLSSFTPLPPLMYLLAGRGRGRPLMLGREHKYSTLQKKIIIMKDSKIQYMCEYRLKFPSLSKYQNIAIITFCIIVNNNRSPFLMVLAPLDARLLT